MRKPTDTVPAGADLEAIQTSVAFKHIANAIEQYRRSFGMAFLCLFAFSIVHVGLVVIANLYTQETRVKHGMLVGSGNLQETPVATATAQQRYDIPTIMSTLPTEQQKRVLSTLKSVNFVDTAGDYRQYTVTGFKLSGHLSSELKLFTSVGHVLEYTRGHGLTLSGEDCGDAPSNATQEPVPRTRKLLSSTAMYGWATDMGLYQDSTSACVDNVLAGALHMYESYVYSCSGDLCSTDFGTTGAAFETKTLAILNCLHTSGSIQDNVDAAMERTRLVLQNYLTNLQADATVLDHFNNGPNQQCVLGIPTLAAVDPATYDLTTGSTLTGSTSTMSVASCSLLSSDIQTFMNGFLTADGASWDVQGDSWQASVFMGKTADGDLTDQNCDGWDISGTNTGSGCSVDAHMSSDELEACTAEFNGFNREYLRAIATTTNPDTGLTYLADYIDQMFGDTESFMNAVIAIGVETVDDENIPLSSILAAFGIGLSEIGASETTDMNIDFGNLTPDQESAVADAETLLRAAKASIENLFSVGLRNCVKENNSQMAIAAVPLINGMIALLGSSDYQNWVHTQNIDAMANSAEHDDTQRANCKAAGELWWMCSVADRTQNPSANFFNAMTATWMKPKNFCYHEMSLHVPVSHNMCQRMGYQWTNTVNYEGVSGVDITAANAASVYEDSSGDLTYQQENWNCQGLDETASIYNIFHANWEYNADLNVLQDVPQEMLDIAASEGCTNLYEAQWTFIESARAYRDMLITYNDQEAISAIMEANLNGNQNVLVREMNIILNGVFEWAPEFVTNMGTDFNTWKATNNADLGDVRAAEDFAALSAVQEGYLSAGEGSEATYGCSTDLLLSLHRATTDLPLMAYDACNMDGHVHRKPWFSGTYFSMILGGFDGFAMYLPPKYCDVIYSAVDVNHKMKPVFDANEYTMDYVVLLHGWGGSSSFLFTVAGVLHYAFHGVAPEGSGASDYLACLNGDMVVNHPGCANVAYPGGFTMIAPDGNACPLGARMWWMNSEFTGFVMDYVIFDLPNYMIHHLGMQARSIGVFGYSMGAFGALSAVNTYTGNIAIVYAAAAPLYPSDCFFAYTCHNICATDVIYCELLFTSFGQVLNSYVILWHNTLTVSSGSLDPIAAGTAWHMDYSLSTSDVDFISCVSYNAASADAWEYKVNGADTMSASELVDLTVASTGYKADSHNYFLSADTKDFMATHTVTYMTKLDSAALGLSSCTYQNWALASVDTCGVISATDGVEDNPVLASPNVAPVAAGSFDGTSTSVHASLSGIDTTSGVFYCEAPVGSANEPCAYDTRFSYNYNGVDINLFDTIWHSSEGYATNGQYSCFAAACQDLQWCLESNLATGAEAYLDPVKQLVAAMKFVPFSNTVHNTMVPSAFTHFWHGTPLVKFLVMQNPCAHEGGDDAPCSAVAGDTSNAYALHPILFWIHSAQNDELGLYAMHVEFVAILLGALTHANSHLYVHQDTKFVADFNDCDGHFFSIQDMWDVVGWFSDSFHSFVRDYDSNSGAVTERKNWKKERMEDFEDWLAAPEKVADGISGLALCWLYGHTWENGAFVSSPQPSIICTEAGCVHDDSNLPGATQHFLHQEPCVAGIHMRNAMHGKMTAGAAIMHTALYSSSEWHDLEQANEIEMDQVSLLSAATAAHDHLVECKAQGIDLKTSVAKDTFASGLGKMRAQNDAFLYDDLLTTDGTLDVDALATHVGDVCFK